mmetsp:Transcript_23112/g.37230  ORF Transcript_23112/g.37230 Transcript_23112/m.37230 type:complete len:326 (+) Transcript_23112:193-1170(+)|eukprot:jgi/Bigna1/86280/estExt_fgenesh1_pg.C_90187
MVENQALKDTGAYLEAIICGVGLCIARKLLDICSFKPLAKIGMKLPKNAEVAEVKSNLSHYLSRLGNKKNGEAEKLEVDCTELLQGRDENLLKFCEACWRATMYSVMIWLGYEALHSREWFFPNVEKAFIPGSPMHREIRTYIIVSVGYYIQLLVYVFVETRRKDFLEMVIHHVITLTLITIAWFCDQWKIGCVICFLHDLSDPFLEVAKIFNYLKPTRSWADPLSTLCFVIFMTIFGITRLGMFPIYVLHPVKTIIPDFVMSFYMLSILQVLHIYWFFLILKTAKKAITGDLNDTREKKSSWDLGRWNSVRKQILELAGSKKDN